MTAEQYFDMCEQMGYEPIEEEIPKSFEDLPFTCQISLIIFNALPDRVGGMSGIWLGKDFSALEYIMYLYEVDYPKEIFEFILIIQQEYSKHYSEEHKRESSKKR
jgi:hypothetical protein